MNKNTSAGKPSRPPPLSLVDYSDEEEVTTPQQSQTSQPMSEDLHTAADHLKSESDAESDPVNSQRRTRMLMKNSVNQLLREFQRKLTRLALPRIIMEKPSKFLQENLTMKTTLKRRARKKWKRQKLKIWERIKGKRGKLHQQYQWTFQ